VARLLGLFAAGGTAGDDLESASLSGAWDIDEALQYAAFLAEDETLELAR
jgi:hypothetical protein